MAGFAKEETDAIGDRSFTLDLPAVTLYRADDESGIIASGSGTVSIAADRTLKLKAWFPKLPREEWTIFQGWVPGRLLDPRDYRVLIGTDWKGRRWMTSRFDPSRRLGEGGVIESTIGEMRVIPVGPDVKRATTGIAYWYDAARIPTSKFTHTTRSSGESTLRSAHRDHEEAEAAGWDLEFDTSPALARVTVLSDDTPLPTNWDLRLAEALSFATGRWPEWSLVEEVVNGEVLTKLRSVSNDAGRITALPPLTPDDPDTWKDYWRLFARYLSHVRAWHEPEMHPMSALVYTVINSQRGPFDAQLLELCVAVEALLSIEYTKWPPLEVPTPEELDRLKKVIEDSEASESMKRRLAGFLPNLREPRAKDRLHALTTAGIVKSHHVKTWDQVRNASAHGRRELDVEKQENLDRLWTLLNLFHRLVLCAIGYSGPHTDYSESGFPTAAVRARSDAT